MARRAVSRTAHRRRLFWALWIALGIHWVVLLGLQLIPPADPPAAMVFSLQVDLLEREGGHTADPTGGALPTLTTQAVDHDPVLEPLRVNNALITTRTSDVRITSQALDHPTAVSLAPERAVDDAQYRDSSELITSRSRRLQPDERATPAGLYGERWRRLMEQLGVQYFPDEARQRRISGRLTLDVAIRADGHLHSIQLLESSGSPLLDQAARRTVLSAAPFEPFPEELRRDYDVLHILRSWEFDFDNPAHGRN